MQRLVQISTCFLSVKPIIFCACKWTNALECSGILFGDDLTCLFLAVPLYITELACHCPETEVPCVFSIPKCLALEHTKQLLFSVLSVCLLLSNFRSQSSVAPTCQWGGQRQVAGVMDAHKEMKLLGIKDFTGMLRSNA